MRRFKFIGNPEEYQWEVKPLFMMTYDHEYLKYHGAENLVENYPEDWHEVFEDESGWISIKDRLPEMKLYTDHYISDPVLCLFDNNYSFTCQIYFSIKNKDISFALCLDDEDIENCTHWMPLPKPPIKTN